MRVCVCVRACVRARVCSAVGLWFVITSCLAGLCETPHLIFVTVPEIPTMTIHRTCL